MSVVSFKRRPPPRKKGQGRGRRVFNGELMDVTTVAVYLGTSENTVRAWMRRGVIPVESIAGRRLIRRSQLQLWLDGRQAVTVDEALERLAALKGEQV